MNSRQIECFLEVVAQHSFSRASETLFLTQSVVSYQVNSLEKELGFPLFSRDKHPVQLTKGGEIFYKEIAYAQKAIKESIELGRAWYTKINKTINIGWLTYIDSLKLAAFVSACQDFLPDVQLNLVPVLSSKDLIPAFQNNEFDIFFVYQDDVQDLQDLSFSPLYETMDYCWVSSNHHLASKTHLEVSDIANEVIVFSDKDAMCRKPAARAYNGIINFNPKADIRWVADYERTAIPMVIAGSCVALAPCAIQEPGKGIVSIPYGHYDPIVIGIAWRSEDQSINTTTCIKLIKKIFSSA